jgi:hypothetical protein
MFLISTHIRDRSKVATHFRFPAILIRNEVWCAQGHKCIFSYPSTDMLKFSMRNFHLKFLSSSNSDAYYFIIKPSLRTTATRLFHTSFNPFYRFSWNSSWETFINIHIISIFGKLNIFQRTPPPYAKLWNIPFPVLFITRPVVLVSSFQMISLCVLQQSGPEMIPCRTV